MRRYSMKASLLALIIWVLGTGTSHALLDELLDDDGTLSPLEQVIGTNQVSNESVQTSSTGAVYIVDQGHPDASDSNSGTESEPFLTMQRAADLAEAGDTVLVKSGVYEELSAGTPNTAVLGLKIQNSGTSTAPIIFAAYPGHHVVIDQGYQGVGFYLQGRDYISIDGFEIRNALVGGVWTTIDGSIGVEVHNNLIYDIDGGASYDVEDNVGAIKLDGCSNCQVTNNELAFVRVDNDADRVNAAGVHSFDMEFTTIRNNHIHDVYNGIFHKRSSGETGAHVFNNLIHDTQIGVLYSVGGFGDPPHVDPLIEYNFFRNNLTAVKATTHETNLESFGLIVRHSAMRGGTGINLRGMTDVIFEDNLFDTTNTQLILVADELRPVNITRSDFNMIDGAVHIIVDQFADSERAFFTLEEWRAHSGHDANSFIDAAGHRNDPPVQAWPALHSPVRGAASAGDNIGPHALGDRILGPTGRYRQPPAAPSMAFETTSDDSTGGSGDDSSNDTGGPGNGKGKGNGGGPDKNKAPSAEFSFSCAYLSCAFDAGASSDRDGSIVAYDWAFGDAHTGSGVTIDHTYGAQGSYKVTLTVTDDAGATADASQTVTVGEADQFSLSASGYKVKGEHHVDLSWQGSASELMDIYRNGSRIAQVANFGSHTDMPGTKGSAFYSYQVCEAGTDTCSNEAFVEF